MLEHTPRPWKHNKYFQVCDATGALVCAVCGDEPEIAERADYIVRACNNHEQLLAICRKFIAAYETRQSWPSKEQVDEARAILSRLEGASYYAT